MSEKWTKGPWFVHPDGPKYCVNQRGTNRHIAMVSCYKSVQSDEEENIANAHIVAAAPEMYEALMAILPYVPISSASDGGAVARSGNVLAADKVRAAIKKARGEA